MGETYPRPEVEKAVIHGTLAPVLLGRDPSQIDRLWNDKFRAFFFSGWAGAEMRAISAVNIAFWDLAGKVLGAPVYQLLRGASRSSIRIYNTCYDHVDFLTESVRLARELIDSGIRAMKIWPFDPIASKTGGNSISAGQIRRWLEPFRRIREELGDSIDVAMEFHGYWNLSRAIRIAALADTYYLPATPHNCGGPVLHFASAHLAANVAKLAVLETVRRHYHEEFAGILTSSLAPAGGELALPSGPGLGVELDLPVLSRSDDLIDRTSI